MLVVQRNVNEWMQLGDDVLVGPTEIGAERVRLVVRGHVFGPSEDGTMVMHSTELGIGESVSVAPGAWVTVMALFPQKVRLGFDVPETMSVHRKEVYDAIRRQIDRER
jgi:carbon storage regulator CsrA